MTDAATAVDNVEADVSILANFYKFRVPRNNTDWEYPRNWLRLPEYVDGLAVVPNESVVSALVSNGLYVAVRVLDRFVSDPHANHLSLLLRQSCFIPKSEVSAVDVVLTHAHFPWNLTGVDVPIVLDTGFMTNEYLGGANMFERSAEIELKRRLAEGATLLTVSDGAAANRLKSVLPEHAPRIKVLPWFLPNVSALSSDEVPRKQAEGCIKMLFVGRDGQRKGLSKVVDALWMLAEKGKLIEDLEVIIVTEDTVPRLPSSVRVSKHDRLPHEGVMDLMRAAQLFVLPTQRDSYGLVFVEAMASGCAILADQKQPRPEILANGNAGLCCDASDAKSVARSLDRLLHDETLRSSLAENAVERFREVYSPEAVSSRLEELMRMALRIHAGR